MGVRAPTAGVFAGLHDINASAAVHGAKIETARLPRLFRAVPPAAGAQMSSRSTALPAPADASIFQRWPCCRRSVADGELPLNLTMPGTAVLFALLDPRRVNVTNKL